MRGEEMARHLARRPIFERQRARHAAHDVRETHVQHLDQKRVDAVFVERPVGIELARGQPEHVRDQLDETRQERRLEPRGRVVGDRARPCVSRFGHFGHFGRFRH
ncbi:thiotemplate mechanism natural product synthetase domain protein [Burkholderia pseudomallei]|nr:thiotemplate mechanism natural product synthetase domain protein [Burkholderia pseudomallei]